MPIAADHHDSPPPLAPPAAALSGLIAANKRGEFHSSLATMFPDDMSHCIKALLNPADSGAKNCASAGKRDNSWLFKSFPSEPGTKLRPTDAPNKPIGQMYLSPFGFSKVI